MKSSLPPSPLVPTARVLSRGVFVGALGLLLAGAIQGQCGTQWMPGLGPRGTNGEGHAVAFWDPDGAGPQVPVLVVGGQFSVAGTAMASHVATYDAVSGTWSALATGTDGPVRALATLPDGRLVAAGDFTTAGGVAANHVAVWDGVAWAPLGGGTNGVVRSLKVLAGGHLVAAGDFDQAGGASANRIARWDGANWLPLGTGIGSTSWDSVAALTLMTNGDLVAAGSFWVAGGVSATNIARWNGATWSTLGSGLSGQIFALTTLSNGNLIAGGNIYSGASANIARWNGTSWSSVAGGASTNGLNGTVRTLVPLANGQFYAGGDFTHPTGQPALSLGGVVRWPGSGGLWSAVGSGVDYRVTGMTSHASGDLHVVGSFSRAGGVGGNNVARWNGTSWSTPGPGLAGSVAAILAQGNGAFVVGGFFDSIGAVNALNVARWDGQSWSPMGSGISGGVSALAAMPNGDVVAGGWWGVSRWNGTAWSSFLPTGWCRALVVRPNGNLVAGGEFGVREWNGASWTTTLSINLNEQILALHVAPNGDLVVGGQFAGSFGTNLVRQNGTAWSASGQPDGSVSSLSTLRNGHLVAMGSFTSIGGVSANYIAQWNGSTWSAMGSGFDFGYPSSAQLVLPNGDLLVAGLFDQAGGVPAQGIARWNGAAWSAVGQGLGGSQDDGLALAQLTNGDVMVGGVFDTAGSVIASRLARLTTTCPASATSYGAGCNGSGGLNVLTATTMPWIGSTFRARATGMPAFAFVVLATGFATVAVPLSALLPQGQAGCSLLVSPDVLDITLPQAGVVESQIAVPNTTALVGQAFHQQVVPLEVDLLLSVTAVTGSNALTMTIGAF